MTALVSLRIDEICAHRDRALELARQAVELRAKADQLMVEAQAEVAMATAGNNWIDAIGESRDPNREALLRSLDGSRAIEGFRVMLDAGVLKRLYFATQAWDMLDAEAKRNLLAELGAGRVPEATFENLAATFEIIAREMGLNFRTGLARTFSQLDRRFKSHDGFKVGSRIIITRVLGDFGLFNRYGEWAAIVDVERCFAILDNGAKPCPGELEHQIRAERAGRTGPHQSVHETRYFRIRIFKNGNAHLWMLRDDLVERVNLELAAYYGAVLADAVPADQPAIERGTALAKDLSFYWTPAEVSRRLLFDGNYFRLRRADGSHGRPRVLEPSAGEGHLVKALIDAGCDVHAVEVHKGRADQIPRLGGRLDAQKVSVQQANFLQLPPRCDFDAVVMNPPFYGTHWMQHVMHAFKWLRPGGVLFAVLPVTAEIGESKAHHAFREWASRYKLGWGELAFEDLPQASFAAAGTRVNTVILRLGRKS